MDKRTTTGDEGSGMSDNPRGRGEGKRCTCWVLLRGDMVNSGGWQSVEYEQVPDPSCPTHGKKIYPILEDDDWGYPSAP